MITPKRTLAFENSGTRSSQATDLLEKKTPESYNEYVSEPVQDESFEEAKIRMRRNLDKLMNYGKYASDDVSTDFALTDTERAEVATEIQNASYSNTMVEEKVATPEKVDSFDENMVTEPQGSAAATDEDLMPTRTTTQFIEGDNASVIKDMEKQKAGQKEDSRLSAKAKLVVALYVVAVTLILALIILNTGVLAVLSQSNAESAAKLSEKVAEYNAVVNEIDAVSSESHIIEVAENELGMIK